MAKGSFAGKLAAGSLKDQEMRTSEVDSRFDRVAEAMAGRPSLLVEAPTTPVARATPAAVEQVSPVIEQILNDGKATRRYTKLPIAVLDDNPLNSRTFYSEEVARARATSIAAEGQLTPAMVTPNPNDPSRYILIDGHYRKRAIRHLNQTEMDCCVLDGLSKVDFYRLARTLNAERAQESTLDVAFGYRKLIEQGLAKTDDELASIVGESRPKVNKLLAIADLPQLVLDVMTKTPEAFGLVIAYELTLYNKIAGPTKTADFAARIVENGLSKLKVEAIRKALEQGPKPQKAMSRQHKIRHNGTEIGTLKDWDSGRIVLDIQVDNEATRQQHLANLRKMFGHE